MLDPTDIDDPQKITFNDAGEAKPRSDLPEKEFAGVEMAIKRMGIGQSLLNKKRKRKWRDCSRVIDKYDRISRKLKGNRTPEEVDTLKEIAEELVTMASAKSEYSSTIRCCLESRRLSVFAIRDEFQPLNMEH